PDPLSIAGYGTSPIFFFTQRENSEAGSAITSYAAAPAGLRVASSVISAAESTLDTGQFSLAVVAMVWNSSSEMPGTSATVTSSILGIAKPSPCFSIWTLAFVSMLFGVKPDLPRISENAIEKQPACAAAINSSGFVAFVSSPNRELNE